MFIWTGFDYRGEPLPYGGAMIFESKLEPVSSYFGIFDLCGFPKDSYYFYKSQWTNEPMLHILPHWNWEDAGLEWNTVPVWCYTNCDSVELFLNGKSLDEQTFSPLFLGNLDMHLKWDVKFEPGTLKVVGKKDGEVVCTEEIKTADVPAQIELIPDKYSISSDGRDLSYITVRILDSEGNFMPIADNQVTFSIEGEGKIRGVCNGDQLSHEDPMGNEIKAFSGQCLVIVQSTTHPGKIKLTATSLGLVPGYVKITSGFEHRAPWWKIPRFEIISLILSIGIIVLTINRRMCKK
jgi:beta-galactosidase